MTSWSTFNVLGVRVHAVQIPDVTASFRDWIAARRGNHFVALAGMHGIMEAQRRPDLLAAYDQANLVVPDGMPLVWIGRHRGFRLRRRVYGPELLTTFCRATGGEFSHFFYGGTEGVAADLAERLQAAHGIRVAGTLCPPFHAQSDEEISAEHLLINASGADLLWVGIGAPKQELWMNRSRPQLTVPVSVGVGAAFDFLTARKPTAPPWMQENGLEWAFRLATEPRRLWRRYLLNIPEFIVRVLLQEFGSTRPDTDSHQSGKR